MPDLLVPTNAAEFWELVQGVAAIAVAIMAGFGLKSLSIARKDIKTRNTRDSLECSIRLGREMASEIIAKNTVILETIAKHKIPIFLKSVDQVKFGAAIEAKRLPEATKWVGTIPPGLGAKCIEAMNFVESWAMFVTTKLADSRTAFGPCGAPFCSFVMQMYPFLVFLRARESSGNFPNTVELFELWYNAKAGEEAQLRWDELYSELQDLHEKGPLKLGHPAAIGTED